MKYINNSIFLFIFFSIIHLSYKCASISSIFTDNKSTILITSIISGLISLLATVLILYLIFYSMFLFLNSTKETFNWLDYSKVIQDVFSVLTISELIRFSISIVLLNVSNLLPDESIDQQLNNTDWFLLSSIVTYSSTILFSVYFVFTIAKRIQSKIQKITISCIYLALICLVNYKILL